MYDLLCKFESVIVLKTLMENIDLNFIGIGDLEEIALYAEELDIELEYIDLDDYYNSDYNNIIDIYNKWFESINSLYLNTKNGLLKLI